MGNQFSCHGNNLRKIKKSGQHYIKFQKTDLNDEDINLLIDQWHSSHISILKQKFKSFATKNQNVWVLNRSGFYQIFQKLDELPQEVRLSIFELFDRKDSNLIDFREFCSVLSACLMGDESIQINLLFSIFDLNNDDIIDKTEAKLFVQASFQNFLKTFKQNKQIQQSFGAPSLIQNNNDLIFSKDQNLILQQFYKKNLEYEDFKDFVQQNFQIKHFFEYFFELVPSVQKEKEIFDEIVSLKTKKNQESHSELYILSNKFFEMWKFYLFENSFEEVFNSQTDINNQPNKIEKKDNETEQSSLLQSSNKNEMAIEEDMNERASEKNLVPQRFSQPSNFHKEKYNIDIILEHEESHVKLSKSHEDLIVEDILSKQEFSEDFNNKSSFLKQQNSEGKQQEEIEDINQLKIILGNNQRIQQLNYNKKGTMLNINIQNLDKRIGERPGCIDHKFLQGEYPGELRYNLKLNFDYVLVQKRSWKKLIEWYGKTIEFKRKIIKINDKLVMDMYPLYLNVYMVDEYSKILYESKKSILISNRKTGQDLLQKLSKKKYFYSDLSPEKNIIYFKKPGEQFQQFKYINNQLREEQLKSGSFLIIVDLSQDIFFEQNYMNNKNTKNTLYLEIGDQVDVYISELNIWKLGILIDVKEDILKFHFQTESYQNDIVIPRSKSSWLEFPNTKSQSNQIKRDVQMPMLNSTYLEKNRIIPGYSGMFNLGNTCYLNSTLQCLLHTPYLRQYFMKDAYLSDLACIKQKTLSVPFAKLVKKQWSIENQTALYIDDFKNALDELYPQFQGMEQHDVHELLFVLLECMSEELTCSNNKKNKEDQSMSKSGLSTPMSRGSKRRSSNGHLSQKVLEDCNNNSIINPDEKFSLHSSKTPTRRKHLTDFSLKNPASENRRLGLIQDSKLSIINELFLGRIRNTRICQNCKHRSSRFEEFKTLSLPVPYKAYFLYEVILFRRIQEENQKANSFTKIDSNINQSYQKLNDYDLMRYSLKLKKGSTLLDFFSEFKKVSLLNSENYVFVEIFEHGIFKNLSFSEKNMNLKCLGIQENSLIVAYEIQKKYNELSRERAYLCQYDEKNLHQEDRIQCFKKLKAGDFVDYEIKDNIWVNAIVNEIHQQTKSDPSFKLKIMLKEGKQKLEELEVDVHNQNISPFHTKTLQSEIGFLWPVINRKPQAHQNSFEKFAFPFLITIPQWLTQKELQYFIFAQAQRFLNYEMFYNNLDILRKDLDKVENNLTSIDDIQELMIIKKDLEAFKTLMKNLKITSNSIHSFRNTEKSKFIQSYFFPYNLQILNVHTEKCLICDKQINFETYQNSNKIQKLMKNQKNYNQGHFNLYSIHQNQFNGEESFFRIEEIKNNDNQTEFCQGNCIENLNDPIIWYIYDPRIVMLSIDWLEISCFNQDSLNISNHSSVDINKEFKEDHSKGILLDECLNSFIKEEEVEMQCDECENYGIHKIKAELWMLPNILIIHLKRFSYYHGYLEKIETLINYPVKEFSLLNWVPQESFFCNDKDTTFELFASVNHMGNGYQGHYTANVLIDDGKNKQWIRFNDKKITILNDISGIVNENGYILFYKKKEMAISAYIHSIFRDLDE